MNKLILWQKCQRISFSRLLQLFKVVSRENRRFKEATIRKITRFWNRVTVHNIKKIADFIKREGKNLKDMLKMIVGEGSKSWNKEFERE